MVILFSRLTIAVLLVQIGLGCSLHGWEACFQVACDEERSPVEVCGCTEAAAAISTHGAEKGSERSTDQRDAGDHDSNHGSHPDHHHHGCSGRTCSFLPAKPAADMAADMAANAGSRSTALDTLFHAGPDAGYRLPGEFACGQAPLSWCRHGAVAVSLRAHVVHGVWLI